MFKNDVVDHLRSGTLEHVLQRIKQVSKRDIIDDIGLSLCLVEQWRADEDITLKQVSLVQEVGGFFEALVFEQLPDQLRTWILPLFVIARLVPRQEETRLQM